MSYVKETLAGLEQMLADKLTAGVVPTSSATLAYWVRQLNAGQAYAVDRLKMVKSASKTTVSGTIVLDDDFKSIDKVIDSNGNELTQISKEDSALATGRYFWITGNHLDDYYLNTPDDETYTVWYNFHPAKMVNTTDECIIADPLAIVCYAYSKLRKAQTDPLEDADAEMAECNRRLDDLSSDMVRNDEGTVSFKLQVNA